MIQLTEEEYCQLVWAAIHDDRRVPDGNKFVSRFWEQLSLEWKHRFNDRETVRNRDQTGAVLRRM